VHACLLIVSGWPEPQLHPALRGKPTDRKDEAAIDIHTVSGVRVDLVRRLEAPDETFTTSAAAGAAHDDYVTLTDRPLALNPQQV
jgi:hypothetical protein